MTLLNQFKHNRLADPPVPVPILDYAHSIPFPPDLPSGLPPAGPCPKCGAGLFWLDAYENFRCYDCKPPPVDALAARMLFAMASPTGYFWQDWRWMRKYPPNPLFSSDILDEERHCRIREESFAFTHLQGTAE